MGKLRWYKRDPEAALNGMAELTLAERGAYNTLIDLLYTRDGIVPDDDVLVARMMRCHWREWRKIKTQLIALNKVRIIDGRLMANRVTETLEEATRYTQDHAKEPARVPQEPGKSAAGSSQELKSANDINGKKYTTTTTPTVEEVVVADAREREPLISMQAHELAAEIAVICGLDLKFLPPAWCGAAMRAQGWLTKGWQRQIVLIAVRGALAKRKTGPPNSIQFFETAITEEIARQARPLPNVVELPAATVEVRNGQNRNDYRPGFNAGGKSHSAFALDYARRAAGAERSGGG